MLDLSPPIKFFLEADDTGENGGLPVPTFFIALAGQTTDVILLAGPGTDKILQSGQ